MALIFPVHGSKSFTSRVQRVAELKRGIGEVRKFYRRFEISFLVFYVFSICDWDLGASANITCLWDWEF